MVTGLIRIPGDFSFEPLTTACQRRLRSRGIIGSLRWKKWREREARSNNGPVVVC